MAITRWQPSDILKWIRKRPGKTASSSDVVSQFKMSRQTASRILSSLVHENKLVKTGSTANAKYTISSTTKAHSQLSVLKLQKRLATLDEDEVFEELSNKLNLNQKLPETVYRIAYYAFTEMLNNAIDHSQGKEANIEIRLDSDFSFSIRDKGVGIFNNIKKGFHLKTLHDAVEHLLKGKQTTAPEAHSGQGIFFTSKIADFFQIRNEELELSFDNLKNDVILGESRSIKGTEVTFKISRHSKRSLQKLFEEYSNEDFEFDKTKYPVIVLTQNGAISRSQARRLTIGLEKFSKIILDFSKVKELGQGFADEIFRIFQNRHPKLVIEVKNANSAVHFMIRRAMKS